jgi:hypothetical protein
LNRPLTIDIYGMDEHQPPLRYLGTVTPKQPLTVPGQPILFASLNHPNINNVVGGGGNNGIGGGLGFGGGIGGGLGFGGGIGGGGGAFGNIGGGGLGFGPMVVTSASVLAAVASASLASVASPGGGGRQPGLRRGYAHA